MKHDAFLLDLDNTIFDYDNAHKPALEKTLSWLSRETQRSSEVVSVEYQKARNRIHRQLQGFAASHSRLLYFQYLLEQLEIAPYELALAADEMYWNIFFENMTMRQGCKFFLQAIASRPVVIITDLTAQLQFRKIVHLGLQEFISGVVTSEEAGCEKPDKKIFELAIAKTGKTANSICMIGDNWEKDILGALQLDMHCYWFNEKEKKRALPQRVIECKNFDVLNDVVHKSV